MTRDYALVRRACESLIAAAEREGLPILIGGFKDRELRSDDVQSWHVPAASGGLTLRSLPKSAPQGAPS